MACERCAGETPTAAYRLYKGGGSRRVNLCKPCRDITALVHALEVVELEPVKEPEAPEAEEPEAEPAEPTRARRGRAPRR